MKKFFCLIVLLLTFSCSKNKPEEPLLLPPNFTEMPDVKNPEKPAAQEKDENAARLKELLLQSD
jgi:hypothetical protein